MSLFFPYRQANGYRSILEAVDRRDARQWLSAYPGTRFCEVEMDGATQSEILQAEDRDARIDGLALPCECGSYGR